MNTVLESIDGHVALSAILAWIGQALVFGTALAGVTWLLVRLLRRRTHATLEATLWSIVLLKFLMPVGPESSLSLSNVCETLYRYSPSALVAIDVGDVDPMSAAASTANGPQRAGMNVEADGWPWTTLVAVAYLAAVVSLLAVRLRSYRALLARCRALPLADESTRELVLRVCRRLGVYRTPSVRISEDFPAPFVMGVFRPLLVLSHRQLVRPDELETVVVHEVTHLRRGDIFVRYLQWIAGTLLFFWPVVAWVNRRIDIALEYACDDWALRHGRLTAGEYARCLLRAIQPMRHRRFAYQPAYMAAHPATIERRIDMILQSPSRRSRRHLWSLLTFAFLFAWGGFALTGAADAKGPAGGEDQTWAPTEEDLKKHTGEVIVHLNSYPAVDVDGDGDFSRPERTAFVVTVVNQFPQVVLEEFPYADYDEDGELSLIEAFDLVRGNTLIGAEEKRAQLAYTEAVSEGTLDPEQAKEMKAEASRSVLAAYHTHLDMVEWLLAEMPSEPSAYDVAATKAELEPIEAKRAAKMDSKKVAKLQHKIQELRTKAAELEGEEAEELEAKVAQLEDQLKQMKQVKMKGETKSKKKVKMKD